MSGADFDFEEAASPGLPGFVQDPIGALRRRWAWMLPVGILGLLATAVFVYLMTPTFLATATVLVRSQQIPEAFVRSTVEEDPLRRIDEMIGQVLTQQRLGQLIEHHDLYAEAAASLPRTEIISRVRANIEIAPAPGYSQAGRGESARIFTVAFEYDEPTTAAKVANEIAGLLPTESVRSRTRKARLTTEFLQRELEGAESALRKQNAKITEFKERYRGELPSELQANLGKLERLQSQRQSLALQIAESANRIAALAAQGGASGSVDPAARLTELRSQLAAESAVLTDRHPSIVALRNEIAAREAALVNAPATQPGVSTTSGLVAAEHVTLRELRSQLRNTEAELATLDVRVGRTPARTEDLGALEEKSTVLRENYLEFLRKVQEAELAQNLEAAQSGERVSVLNWASPPTRPERDRWKYLLAGIIASFCAAGMVGVLFETFDPVLLSTAQMEAASDLPVLGSVPRIV